MGYFESYQRDYQFGINFFRVEEEEEKLHSTLYYYNQKGIMCNAWN